MNKSISEFLALATAQKEQLDALRPFDTTILKNLREWFRIGYIHHSNAIEGNSFSLSEVKVLLEDGITIGGKTIRELKETLNHGEVMDNIQDLFTGESKQIDATMVLDLHKVLMQGLLHDEYRGKRRTIEVLVTGSEQIFPGPAEVPILMETFFASSLCHPKTLEDVARLHYECINIHPFVDGNGRIVRLLMNIGLIKIGYLPIIIPFAVRPEYINSLKREDFDTRYHFFLWQVYENHKDYIRFLSSKIS